MQHITRYNNFILNEQTTELPKKLNNNIPKHGGVGYDFFNNPLTSEIVNSPNWKLTKNVNIKGEVGPDVKGKDIAAYLVKVILPNPTKEKQEEMKSKGWVLVWIDKTDATPSQEIMSGDKTVTIPFTDSKFYDSGSSNLSAEFKKKFDEEMGKIDKDKIVEIEIESSTDKMPIRQDLKNYLSKLGLKPDNEGLSIHRGNKVVELIKNLGIPVEKTKITPKVEQGTVPEDPKEQLRRKKLNLGYDDSARYIKLKVTTSGDVETIPGDNEKNTYYYERLIPKTKAKVPPEIKLNQLEMDWGFCPAAVWEEIGQARKRVWKKIKKFLGFKN
jgi:hypothetical protein